MVATKRESSSLLLTARVQVTHGRRGTSRERYHYNRTVGALTSFLADALQDRRERIPAPRLGSTAIIALKFLRKEKTQPKVTCVGVYGLRHQQPDQQLPSLHALHNLSKAPNTNTRAPRRMPTPKRARQGNERVEHPPAGETHRQSTAPDMLLLLTHIRVSMNMWRSWERIRCSLSFAGHRTCVRSEYCFVRRIS